MGLRYGRFLVACHGPQPGEPWMANLMWGAPTEAGYERTCWLKNAIVRSQASLAAGGVNMSRVNFVVRTTDTIWIRDYGPRYIYQGGCRAIVDHM